MNMNLSDLAVPATGMLFVLEDRDPATLRPATEDEAVVIAGLTLTVPIDPEYCGASGPAELTPFAGVAKLLPGTMQDGFIEHIARVDDDRVLGLSRVAAKLYLFRRASPPGRPAATIDFSAASGTFASATGLAITRDASPNGTVKIFVAGRTAACMNPSTCQIGMLWELALSSSSPELTLVATSTRVPGVALTSVIVDSKQRTIVTGEAGTLLVRNAAKRPSDVRLRPPPSPRAETAQISTSSPASPIPPSRTRSPACFDSSSATLHSA